MSTDTPDLTPTEPAEPAPYGSTRAAVLAPTGPGLAARLGAEALGTFALVLVGVGTLLYANLSGVGSLGTALAFGLVVVGAGLALGHVSGGHFNPAITLGTALAGRTRARDLLPYWVAQLVGGAIAAAALLVTVPAELAPLLGADSARAVFSRTANGWGEHSPLFALAQGKATFGLVPALVIEGLAALVLVAVVLGAIRRRRSRRTAPIAIGLAYAAVLLVTLPITNGGVNPARSTASALFSDGWALGQLWLFWVAPLVGAAIAGLVYRAFVLAAPAADLAGAQDDDALDDTVDVHGFEEDQTGDEAQIRDAGQIGDVIEETVVVTVVDEVVVTDSDGDGDGEKGPGEDDRAR